MSRNIVAVSGSRSIMPADRYLIEVMLLTELARGGIDEFVFGGALGTDTIALSTVGSKRGGRRYPKITIVVPFRAKDQPAEARDAIEQYADQVVELRLPKHKGAYHIRNEEILNRASRLLAFWDGRSGGTRDIMRIARERAMPVQIIPFSKLRNARRLTACQVVKHKTPFGTIYYHFPEVGLYALDCFNLHGGMTIQVVKMKRGKLGWVKQIGLAKRIVHVLKHVGIERAGIIPLPRRKTDQTPPIAPVLNLVQRISKGKYKDMTGCIFRARGLVESLCHGERMRCESDEHRASMGFALHSGTYGGQTTVLIDDVFTSGATMEGAKQLIANTCPNAEIVCFAILVAGSLGMKIKGLNR